MHNDVELSRGSTPPCHTRSPQLLSSCSPIARHPHWGQLFTVHVGRLVAKHEGKWQTQRERERDVHFLSGQPVVILFGRKSVSCQSQLPVTLNDVCQSGRVGAAMLNDERVIPVRRRNPKGLCLSRDPLTISG